MKNAISHNIIKGTAFLFIVIAVIVLIMGITNNLPCWIDYIGSASALATLAGAILVFSTLEMQSWALNEEKNKNDVARFDSRFYPILSSFRTDAANMDIFGDYISPRGIGAKLSDKGEKAFAIAKSITMAFSHQRILTNTRYGIGDSN